MLFTSCLFNKSGRCIFYRVVRLDDTSCVIGFSLDSLQDKVFLEIKRDSLCHILNIYVILVDVDSMSSVLSGAFLSLMSLMMLATLLLQSSWYFFDSCGAVIVNHEYSA